MNSIDSSIAEALKTRLGIVAAAEPPAATLARALVDKDGNVGPLYGIETITAARTLTLADNGKEFFLAAADAGAVLDVTLPSPIAGWRATFIVKTAPAGGFDYNIGNSVDNIKGHVLSTSGALEDADQDGDLITFESGAAVAGDRIHLISDGTSFFAQGSCAVAGGILITD